MTHPNTRLAAIVAATLLAGWSAVPAVAQDQKGPDQKNNELAAHRAVYELKLANTRSKSTVSARGRILYDFTGSVCAGYTLEFRQVSDLDNGEGKQTLSDLLGVVTSIPRDLARLMKDARQGRMRVDLDLKRLDRFGDRLDRSLDRATMGIMTASLVVGSSIVMTVEGGPRVFGVSLLTYCGLVGYLVAFANSLWIIFSMWRSGRR